MADERALITNYDRPTGRDLFPYLGEREWARKYGGPQPTDSIQRLLNRCESCYLKAYRGSWEKAAILTYPSTQNRTLDLAMPKVPEDRKRPLNPTLRGLK